MLVLLSFIEFLFHFHLFTKMIVVTFNLYFRLTTLFMFYSMPWQRDRRNILSMWSSLVESQRHWAHWRKSTMQWKILCQRWICWTVFCLMLSNYSHAQHLLDRGQIANLEWPFVETLWLTFLLSVALTFISSLWICNSYAWDSADYEYTHIWVALQIPAKQLLEIWNLRVHLLL